MPVMETGQVRKRNVLDVLQTLKQQNFSGIAKKVLVRVDFNVPMSPDGEITDLSALPVLLGSHD